LRELFRSPFFFFGGGLFSVVLSAPAFCFPTTPLGFPPGYFFSCVLLVHFQPAFPSPPLTPPLPVFPHPPLTQQFDAPPLSFATTYALPEYFCFPRVRSWFAVACQVLPFLLVRGGPPPGFVWRVFDWRDISFRPPALYVNIGQLLRPPFAPFLTVLFLTFYDYPYNIGQFFLVHSCLSPKKQSWLPSIFYFFFTVPGFFSSAFHCGSFSPRSSRFFLVRSVLFTNLLVGWP